MDQPAAATPAPNAAKPRRKVLFVEDEHFIEALYTRALNKGGYDVTNVVDGQKALEEAKTNQYDIILLDLMVPNLTGTEILSQLRQQVPDLRAKVIITTNLEQKEATRQDIEKQADGYIIKAEMTPKQMVQLLDRIG